MPLRQILRALPLLFLLSASSLASAQTVAIWGDAGVANVPTEALSGVRSVVAGDYHIVALKTDGRVLAWGSNTNGQCDVPANAQTSVIAVAAGRTHSMALRSDKSVVVWGGNDFAQRVVPTAANSGVTAISANGEYCLALKGGGVLAWGDNRNGQCNVPVSAQAGVVAISAGASHALALKSDGSVVAWGSNASGESTVPFTAQSEVASIAAGNGFSLALKANGGVVAWGNNVRGQTSPPVEALTGVAAIAAGAGHAIAVKTNGKTVAWGDNPYGQTNVPTEMGSGVLSGAAGQRFSVGLQAEAWLVSDYEWTYSTVVIPSQIRLSQPAGPGGVTVGLVSDDPHLEVYSPLYIPEGAKSVFTSLYAYIIPGTRTFTARTVLNGTATVPYRVTIVGFLANLAANRPNVIGGSSTSAKLTLTLDINPLMGGINLDLASSDPSVEVPATVGTDYQIEIPLVHKMVATDRNVKITASYEGKTVAVASIGIKAMGATVEFVSPKVISGDGTYGVLTLSAVTGPALTVSLSSNDPAVQVPATVKVNAGARLVTFPVTTSPVAQNKIVAVTAKVGTRTFSSNLELAPAASVTSLTLPKFVYGNNKAAGTVTISRAAPAGGFVVTLSADGNLSVPTTVTVPEGTTRVNFDAIGGDVANVANAILTATGRLGSATAGIEVRPLALTALSLSDTKVKGGGNVMGTVTLNVPVAVDTPVSLSSDSSFATVPATVIVPAGSSAATFTIKTKVTTAAQTATITAMKGTKSLSKALKVQP